MRREGERERKKEGCFVGSFSRQCQMTSLSVIVGVWVEGGACNLPAAHYKNA